MSDYLFIEHQEGGCDYTIGCGIRITKIEAKSYFEAVQKFKKGFLGEYDLADYKTNPLRADNAPDAVEIYLIQKQLPFNIDLWVDEWDAVIEEQKSKEKEDVDRAEYERLKQKFEESK